MKASRSLASLALAASILNYFHAASNGQPQGNPPNAKPGAVGAAEGPKAPARPALPVWLAALDADGDGQVSLFEWRAGRKAVDEFAVHDLNGDGFITLDEVLWVEKQKLDLKLVNGQAVYAGNVEVMGGDRYRGKVSFKILTVELEGGKAYQFDYVTTAFHAVLFLEDATGEPLAESISGNIGETCRLVHRATRAGKHRVVVTSTAGVRTGAFTLTIRVVERDGGPPDWFKQLDANGDGQISLFEWQTARKPVDEFAAHDLNGDGFITLHEVLLPEKQKLDLKLVNGQTAYAGTVEEVGGERYRGKVSYKVLTVELDTGRTYQFDYVTSAFHAVLFLEDADGEPLAEKYSPNVGENCRLVYRATRTGKHRVVATSTAGVRTGAFTLSIRIVERGGGPPPWFKQLDADGDGQVSLFEWQTARKPVDEFGGHDTNGDGFITAEEVLQAMKREPDVKVVRGEAVYTGTVETVAVEDKYREKISYKILTVELEAGKRYQFDHISKVFQAFLFLEDAAGVPLAESSSSNIGENCRLVYQVTKSGTYRVVATSAAGYRTGPFTLSIRVEERLGVVPGWFKELDADGDGQISLFEWRAVRKTVDEFGGHDANGDGFITLDEVLWAEKRKLELKLVEGVATYTGTVEEVTGEKYRGRSSYKILTVELESGKTYQFDYISKSFQAYLYLEDADGEPLAEKFSRAVGETCRLVHRATRTGKHRLVATSAAVNRTGPFTLSIRIEIPNSGLPPWFKELDANGDGQVSLFEWRTGRKSADEFATLDANGDGVITPDEAGRVGKREPDLKIVRGQGTYSGAVEEAKGGERCRGKISFKILVVELEAGKTYQFDHISKSYQAFLYLEDAVGELLAESSSDSIGANCRLVHRVTKSGTYRVVATSLGGFRTGAFQLTVRAESRYDGLPPWFQALDADGDGQVSLFEWRTGGKAVDDFAALDANGDGFVTPNEVPRELKK